mmetsp:Transcript_30533/g.64328  ORF Transcript_30533/g.64328 Transcript_30533/m.64328 type:complete len:255 (+) Transcript_30533:70-834(+)
MLATDDIETWKQAHRQLTIAVAKSRDNIAAELAKRRFLLEEIARCKVPSITAGGGNGGAKVKKKVTLKKTASAASGNANKGGKKPTQVLETTESGSPTANKKWRSNAKKPSPKKSTLVQGKIDSKILKGKSLQIKRKDSIYSSEDDAEDMDDDEEIEGSDSDDSHYQTTDKTPHFGTGVGESSYDDSEDSDDGYSDESDLGSNVVQNQQPSYHSMGQKLLSYPNFQPGYGIRSIGMEGSNDDDDSEDDESDFDF